MGYYDDEIKRLKDEQARAKSQEDFNKISTTLRDLYDSLLAVGFTEEQAYELLIIQLKK